MGKYLKIMWVLMVCVVICSGMQVGQASGMADPESRYAKAGIEEPEEFEAFFLKLQRLVAADDRERVADCVIYPLRVNGKNNTMQEIALRESFLLNYEGVMTEQVKEALRKQKTDDLFVNYQGVMIGRGEIWLKQKENDRHGFGICTVNLF